MIVKRFLRIEFKKCSNRDVKSLINSSFLTVVLIAALSLTLLSTLTSVSIKACIAVQMTIPFALLVSVCILRKMLGFFLSYAAFAVPFFVLLFKGQMLGPQYEDLSGKD